MNIKKIILGEKMPDKNDPKYKELHEQSFNAGTTFAKATRLDKGAAKIQGFAQRHPRIFLGIVFGIVLFCVVVNLLRIGSAVQPSSVPTPSVIEQQEMLLQEQRHRLEEQVQVRAEDAKANVITPNK